jgi:Kelch motif
MRGRELLVSGIVACSAWAQGIWEPRAPFPVQATEVSSAALNGKVYAICGLTERGSSNNLYIYDPSFDQWSQGFRADLRRRRPLQRGCRER